jgi:asparagine synthase (glutamine-hydrolysing)
MCGIAGYFSNTIYQQEFLKKMSRRIRHRGPDGEGYSWFSETAGFPDSGPDTPKNCIGKTLPWLPDLEKAWPDQIFFGGFAHRRLAIVDLESGGHQPMCSSDGRYWITFNGEIYNHPELRETLKKEGHTFKTRSDTEVILAAYQQWGYDCLQQFNGMWSFAIYDTLEGRLFAARDRFGVKPFYFYQKEGLFVFASEQKAILAHPEVQTGINEAAVFDYFVFGQIEYQEESFFRNIKELAPSHMLTWDRHTGNINIQRYFRLEFSTERVRYNESKFKEYSAHTYELLENAIKLRLRADVEVGTCLSGGLDSSAITGLMQKILGRGGRIKTFSAVFPGQPFDESHWIKEMAAFASTAMHTVSPQGDELLHDLDDLMLCQDIPIWSTSTYAQYRVMKLVQETGIKVVLDGQGGDEVFAGYGQHTHFYTSGQSLPERLGGNLSIRKLGFHLKQQMRFDWVYRLHPALASKVFKLYFSDLSLLNPEFYKRNRERFLDMRSGYDKDLNSRLVREMENTSLKAYLKCEDRCSMWFGVESRTPFADDHPLIKYVFSIPQAYKMRDDASKLLLRDAIKGLVPETIRTRTDKLGYTTPNNEWIRKLEPHMKESAGNLPLEIFDQKQIRLKYDKIFKPAGDTDNGRVFKYFSFARWYQIYSTHLV